MTSTGTARAEESTGSAAPSGWVAVVLVLVVGLLVGALTSVLQTYLDAPWASLVNAASPWLTPAFLLGALWRRPTAAFVAGLTTCLLELVGYYTMASARGFGVSHGMLAFWAACGLVGGPVFGVAGWLWWRGPKKLIGSGAAVLAAGFLSEAVVAYGWRLHYWSSAVLFGVLAILAIGLLGIKRNQHRAAARWLVLVLPVGLLAEFALELVYKQSF